MKYKTVVKAMEPVFNKEGEPMDKDGNVIELTGKSKNIPEQAVEEVLYYLLHWGLHMEILVDHKNDQNYPVTYTVGICQHIKTGEIKIFAPEELTVVGKEEAQ